MSIYVNARVYRSYRTVKGDQEVGLDRPKEHDLRLEAVYG